MGRNGPLTYSYFRGFATPVEGRSVEKYLVACDETTGAFVMVDKATVKPTRLTRSFFGRPPTWALDFCHDYATCTRGANCTKLHVTEAPTELAVHDDDPMLVCLKNGTNTYVKPSQMQPTCGLMFVSTLLREGVVSELYPWVCHRFLNGTCFCGTKCLALHVPPELVKDIARPPNEAATPLAVAMQPSIPMTPGLQAFIDNTLVRMGLRNIGDVAVLSNTVFDALMHRDTESNPRHQKYWLLLMQQRNIGRTTPLTKALMQFPGIDLKTMDRVAAVPGLLTVGDLLKVKPRVLYGLPLRA